MADIPKIRFRGFTEEWERRKVLELFKVIRGYVLVATLTETIKQTRHLILCTHHEQKIMKCDELKEVKKYMLQNMFPQKG